MNYLGGSDYTFPQVRRMMTLPFWHRGGGLALH